MAKKVTANGKTFTFSEDATVEQIGQALDEYFKKNPQSSQGADQKKKDLSKMAGSVDYGKGSQAGSIDFGLPTKGETKPEGSMVGEDNPIVSNIGKLQTEPTRKTKKAPVEQDLRKVDTSMPSDVIDTSPAMQDKAESLVKTPQGEFYDVLRKKENDPRRVDTFDKGTDEYNDALVRDKIDYLWNIGETDAANQLKETYEEILSEKGSGDLSRGQEEKYRELITQAQVDNNEYIQKELRVVDSKYKVKDFYKDNASTIQEINKLASEIDLGVSNERRNVLESQINALQGVLKDSMDKTGITADVLDAYSNIASKFVDPRIVYEKATTQHLREAETSNTIGAERQADVQKYMGALTPIQVAGQSTHRAVDAFAETVVNGALSIVMQTPKVLGDLLGDTDYDWADEAYDKASGLKNYVREEMSWGNEEDAPTYMMLSRVFGQAAGSMATMSGGGALANMVKATQTATKAGTFGTTMMMQMADNYESALDEGMDQQEAALFGTWSSILSATIEQIAPEGVPPMKMTRLRDAIKEGLRGKELADVALDSFWQYSKNITKEGGEEVFEAAVGDINKQLAGYNPENLFSPKEYKEAVLGAVMVGGAMTAFRSKKSRPYMVAESLYDIAEITEANLPTMTKESLKTQKEMHEIRVSLEAVPTFGQLDKESKVLAFDAMLRKLDLEQAQKEVGEVDGGQIAAEIEKVNNELKEILTPKAEVKAVEETENIPVLPAEEVVQETQTTQQNNETASEPYQDLGVQGQDQKGNARGSADTKVAEPASKRNPNEIEAVIRKRDEQIGQILFDSNRGDRDNDTGKQGMDRDTTPQAILGDRGEQNDEGVGGMLDGQTNDRGDGESASALQARVKDARQQLESKVNSLLSKSKSYNNYKLSVRQSNVGQNKLNEIKKEAASLGLNISYLGGKVRITNKEGKGVMPRGTARKIQEDNEVFKRAMDMTSPDEYVEVSKRLIQGSLKVSPNMFSEMTGLQEDSAEFKAAKRSGLISNKGVNDVGKYVSEQMNEAGNTFDVDKVKDSLNLLLTSTKGDIKSNLIKTIRDREASQTKSEDQQKFDSEIDTIVEQATESFEKSGKTDRVEFIENAIKQLSRKNDLFDETTLENEALKKFRNDELVREREKNYTPYDTDETFSEGGEDAPFQEIDDKSVEAINIFYDAYDKGDLGDAIESVMDFIDANPEARAGFVQHLRENRDTLVAGKKKEKKIMAVKSREDFKNAIKELVPQISDTDIESLAIVGDAMVKYALKLDRDLSNSEAWEVVQGHITNDLSNVIGLTQGVKGATSVEKGITAYTEAADISTLIHEPAHNFLGLLEYMAANGNEKAAAHIETINKFAKGEEGRKFFERSKEAGESWAKGEYNENDPTFRQELFARSAEKYFIEGNKTGFSTQMAQVFESFAKFLKDLYKSIKNSPELIELSDEMRSLFDAIYGKEAVEELNSLGDTRKLRNVIRAFVENSNLPAKDKERLAKNPDNIAEVFSFESMEKLVDDLISSYGIDAVVDEAMKEFSAIPLELKSVVYGRGLMDLRKRIKTSSGNTRDSLQERYDNIYEVSARLGHTAGFYNAYFAKIYRQDPEAVAKSIRKNFRKTMNSEVDMERAEDAATEVKKELEKEEIIAEVLEEYDILSSIDDLKQLEKAIKATEAKIEKLKKESKIVATAVSITKDGKAPTRDRAIAKMKANEAAKKFKDSFTKKTLNANINPEMLVYGVDWARWTLIGKAMDFASFFDTGVKTFGSDAQGLMGEFYKGAVKELRAEGYDVSMLTEDSSVDTFMEFIQAEIKYKESRIKALKEQNARNSFASEVVKDKSNTKKLKEFAQDLKDVSGSNELFDLIDVVEKKQKEAKDIKDKAAKEKEYAKIKKEAAREAETKIGQTIKKALIDAGFEKRDFTGNPTGMVDWKAIVKDSKDVEKTLNKIMAVIPDASPAMEAILRERIADAITEKKKKAIENFIKSRQRSDERKKRNATSRPTRLDRLMDLYKIGDIKKPEILQLIAEDFGIKESSVLDEKFITEWGAKRADAAANERWLEVAELDEKMQAFLDARANPNFSADRIQSDFVQALLASPVTSMQNATNLYDTALFSPIFDNLIAQVSRKGVGDKFIMKATLKAVGKAFIVAFDQAWNGGVDVISAQAERTGNRESAPRVRYYENSRKSTGQKGNRFIRFRNAADDPRQKLIRLFPRLNAFTDAFSGVITQETKTYLALREGYIDQGYTLRQASEKAWDILNHDAFSAAFAQAAKEYPNANKLRQKRRAYEILEGNVFKENKEAFRRGQLSANIANLKSPDLGILSGIGWLINYMANPISSAFKSLEKRTDNETFKKMLKAVDATIGNMLRGVTLFLKPSLYFAENAIKYAATAHPALAVYTAIRLFAMGGMNLVAGKKEYDAHRISKDIGRGIVGYLLYLAMGMDDEEEREKKLIGTGPKDKIEGIPESEQAAFRTWDGISFNMLGPMALYAQVKSTEGNNKRFREDQSVFSIVNMMALAPFTEGIARAYKQIDSEKSGYDIISEYIAQRSGMAINPLARTFNDVGGTLDYKQKPIGIKDKFLASVGLSIMIDRPMVDAYGNEYYVGSTNAYSLDGMFSKHLIEHAERNKALNDYRQKYNVPLESLVERKFAKYYDKQLATIMDEELRYDISVKASKIRGEVFTNYINMYPEGRVKPLSDTEYQTELAKYDKEDQQAIKDGKKVLLQEMNASGKYRAELYDVGNTDVTNAIKDAKIFGRTYLEQIPITIIEKEIGSDFSKMNSAAKKYARFFVAKEQKLDLSPLMNWGEIDKEIETLNDYGYKEKDGTE
jgi:hypothetical protein